MLIRVPMVIVRAWDRFCDVVNIELYRRGRIEIRLIDIILVVGFVFTINYYYWVGGWKTAITGALMYIFCGMIGLWFWRSRE